jgi:hypothetical protein
MSIIMARPYAGHCRKTGAAMMDRTSRGGGAGAFPGRLNAI